MLATSGQEFPTFRFGAHPWWTRIYHGICFLPGAFRVIRERRLSPTFSFHILNAQDRPIGISGGDIRYPGTVDELSRLQPLVICVEDKRFFRHCGVDIRGIVRAAAKNLRYLRITQGGSTITQQLVRNTLLVPERSVLRKLFEVILALKVEKHFSKREILDLYCNHVYLGNGIRGFPGAAKIIFRRNIASLSQAQVCGLIGLLRTPTKTFPDRNLENFLQRQRKIAEIVDPESRHGDFPATKPNPIDVGKHRCPRFTQIVRAELTRLNGCTPNDVRRVGLTIDNVVQSSLNETLRDISRLPDVSNAAGVILSTVTADVLGEAAWESGRDAQFSPSYFGSVQPGSTFKTFALLSALKQGITLDQLLESAPFESSYFHTTGNTAWRVRNYANMYRGLVTLCDAFKYSDNTAFARLMEMLDTHRVFSVFKDFGLCDKGQGLPAIVLGGLRDGVNLLSLAAAYRAIANGAAYTYPRIVQYAEFTDGSFLSFPRSQEILLVNDYRVVRDLQFALRCAGPSIRGAKHAGKSGTTSAGSLLAAYNDQIASVIWVGYGRPMAEGDPKAIDATSTFERFMNMLLGHKSDLLSI